MNKSRNKKIEYLRALSCIAVFLYHLGVLKGGYLAVGSFFVLSGYFTASSLMKRRKHLVGRYYLNRFLGLYLPMLIFVFVTVCVVSLFSNYNWVNLKNETSSVLLGYNNYWQLSADQDYFVRNTASPFMHMWYLSILLQFELIFPLLYLPLKKLAVKFNALLPFYVMSFLNVAGFLLFSIEMSTGRVMAAYYGSFSRCFSLFLGVLLALFHQRMEPLVFEQVRLEKVMFVFDLLVFAALFIFGNSSAYFMVWGLLGVSLLTMRFIDHSIALEKEKGIMDTVVSILSRYSYEIYLVQYPIIFLFSRSGLSPFIQIPSVIVLTLVFSLILKNALDRRKIMKKDIATLCLCGLLLLSGAFGVYRFVNAKDHSAEIAELEQKLSENEKLIEERNKEYRNDLEMEESEWETLFAQAENKEEAVKQMLEQMPVLGIGDSVMLDAYDLLYEKFPNGYFDCKISRDLLAGEGILSELKGEEKLPDIIILCLSTNGDYIESRNERLMEICEGKEVFWVDAVGADDPKFNERFAVFAANYENLHIVEWEKLSKDHPEYFYYDGIHVIGDGAKALTKAIYDKVYEVWLDKYEQIVNEAIKDSEEERLSRVAFYGDEGLVSIYTYLAEAFDQAVYNVFDPYDADKICEDLNRKAEEESLEHNIIFLFDKKTRVSENDLKKFVGLCPGHQIYICDLRGKYEFKQDNVTLIDFSQELDALQYYLNWDKSHLSDEGNAALAKKIIERVNKNLQHDGD